MKKGHLLLLLGFVFWISTVECNGQDDVAAVRVTLEHYTSGDPERVEKAFHSLATMKYIDAKTSELKDVPIADYISRIKTNPATPGSTKKEIISINVEGSAAQGKIKIETDKAILYDFMSLLKIKGEWKIVSKIFSRQDK